MQNLRGIIKFFTWVLVFVCFVQLSFTLVARVVESRADAYAANAVKVTEPAGLSATDHLLFKDSVDQITKTYRRNYLDSVAGLPVWDYPVIKGIYTYKF